MVCDIKDSCSFTYLLHMNLKLRDPETEISNAAGVPSVSLLDRHSSTPHTVEERLVRSFLRLDLGGKRHGHARGHHWSHVDLWAVQRFPKVSSKVQEESVIYVTR